jgi:ABC-type phosphate transport system substrate-binding protein
MSRRISLAVAAAVLTAATAAPATEPAFKIIVNAKMAGRTITRDVVAQVYLGKAQRWADGNAIVAVDLSSTSVTRQAFSQAVLEMSVEGVKNHWLQMVLGGKRPPITKQSDEDVIAFVAGMTGGIGYVSETATLPATVRAVELHQ